MRYEIEPRAVYFLSHPELRDNLAIGTLGGLTQLIGREEACAELDRFVEENLGYLCVYDGVSLRAYADEAMRKLAMMASAMIEAKGMPRPEPVAA